MGVRAVPPAGVHHRSPPFLRFLFGVEQQSPLALIADMMLDARAFRDVLI